MTVPIFVKTCLRDADLVATLVRAAQHHWKGKFRFHVLVDRSEFLATSRIIEPPPNVEIRAAEDIFPEGAHIPCGYHRQQWYKIQAPSWLGKHLQMDSDMIPCMFLDIEEFFEGAYWDYGTPNMGESFHYITKLKELGFTYEWSFMCATGWVLFPEVSAALLKRVPNLLEHYMEAESWDDMLARVGPLTLAFKEAHDKNPDLTLEEFGRGQELRIITEYNLLGETAFTDPELHKLYTWTNIDKTARNLLHRASFNLNGRLHVDEKRTDAYVHLREALRGGWNAWKPPEHKPDPQRFMRQLKNFSED